MPSEPQLQPTTDRLHNAHEKIVRQLSKVIVGQQYMLERLLIGLLAQGHILLEGLPGLAKTLAINTLSKAIDAQFHRIQFTPDLLPADLVGTRIFNQQTSEFSTDSYFILSEI